MSETQFRAGTRRRSRSAERRPSAVGGDVGLGIDRAHDEADLAVRRRVACPTLVLWSRRDDMEALYGDPLWIWQEWTDDLRVGHAIDSGTT